MFSDYVPYLLYEFSIKIFVKETDFHQSNAGIYMIQIYQQRFMQNLKLINLFSSRKLDNSYSSISHILLKTIFTFDIYK